jgi:hypothetical protein
MYNYKKGLTTLQRKAANGTLQLEDITKFVDELKRPENAKAVIDFLKNSQDLFKTQAKIDPSWTNFKQIPEPPNKKTTTYGRKDKTGNTLVKIPTDVNISVIGDLHGQTSAVDKAIAMHLDGLKDGTFHYLFLGDYVDRGPDPFGTWLTALTLARLFPGRVTLLKGNHETREANSGGENNLLGTLCALYEDNKDNYAAATSVYNTINDNLFNKLPISAIHTTKENTSENIHYFVHGGPALSFYFQDNWNQATQLPLAKVEDFLDSRQTENILWSDPNPQENSSL